MSRRLLIHHVLRRLWAMIIPMFVAMALAAFMLVKAEPVFVSSTKLWNKEKQEGSNLLRVQRGGPDEKTYAEVQREILLSDRVLGEVVDRTGLIKPPPSQSIYSRYWLKEKKAFVIKDEKAAKSGAIDALRGSVSVDLVNREIISVHLKMNDANLARDTLRVLIEAYRQEYLNILLKEVSDYEKFLFKRLQALDEAIKEREQAIAAFGEQHPEGITRQFQSADSTMSANPLAPLLSDKVDDVSPAPMILRQLAELRIKLIQVKASAGPDSFEKKMLEERISELELMLEDYQKALGEKARLAVQFNRLRWELAKARSHYSEISQEYNRILLSRGSKVKQVSGIVVLDDATLSSYPVYPRKKFTMLAAGVLGALMGLALIYVLATLDRSFSQPEQLEAATDYPVLATVNRMSRREKRALSEYSNQLLYLK